jgi:serine/threonine-protein kinase
MDWNNLRLRRMNEDGTIETIMGIGFEDFPTDGAFAKDTPLHHASDIEFDAEWNLYIAGDHVPVVFRVGTDNRVFTVAGTQDYGYDGDGGPALQAKLATPFGVLPDANGGFYISDVDAHVVRYVDAAGIIDTVAGTGVAGYSGDNGPAKQAQVGGPSRLQFGPDGAIYFCEIRNHVVRRIAPDGTISTVAGTGVRGYSGDNGPATQAQFDTPYDLRFSPNGDLYIADTGNNVIRRVDGAGTITTVVGIGAPDFSGDGGPGQDCELRRPSAVNFDAEGSMWIADTSNQRVRRVWHFLASFE